MTGPDRDAQSPEEPLPRLAAGTVLRLDQSDWKYGRHPLRLRVEQVREDLSVYYGKRWVWISGEQLDSDGDSMGHLDALVRVGALPADPEAGELPAPVAGWSESPDSPPDPCHHDDHDPDQEGHPMIASLECVVLDCPDVRELADFYQAVVGGAVNRPDPRWSLDDDWATLHTPGGLVLCFQRVMMYQPPSWPDPGRPQQFHLDFGVTDIDRAEQEVLAHGATALDRDRPWRVYADPAGHPFCLVPHGAG